MRSNGDAEAYPLLTEALATVAKVLKQATACGDEYRMGCAERAKRELEAAIRQVRRP